MGCDYVVDICNKGIKCSLYLQMAYDTYKWFNGICFLKMFYT